MSYGIRKAKVVDKYGREPIASNNHHDILAIKGLDAVITSSAWVVHVDICIGAMNAGVAVASEVGGAYSINQLWELVRTHEKTGVPYMLLENCCYGKKEMAVLNMVKKDIFGELYPTHELVLSRRILTSTAETA